MKLNKPIIVLFVFTLIGCSQKPIAKSTEPSKEVQPEAVKETQPEPVKETPIPNNQLRTYVLDQSPSEGETNDENYTFTDKTNDYAGDLIFSRSRHDIKAMDIETTRLSVHYSEYMKYSDNIYILIGHRTGIPEQTGDQVRGRETKVHYAIGIFKNDVLNVLNISNIEVSLTIETVQDKEKLEQFKTNLMALNDDVIDQIASRLNELDFEDIDFFTFKSTKSLYYI